MNSVLVIDEDVSMTEILKALLDPRAFKVHSVHQLQAGIDAVRRLNPDVIVLDITEGWQACRSIREISKVPILVLSALNKPSAVAQALDEGADDYLIKPVPSGVFVAHLNNLIRRAQGKRVMPTARAQSL